MTGMAARVLFQLTVTGVQVVFAIVALGIPDLGQAVAFMTGGVPTAGGALALLQVLLWLTVLGACGFSVRLVIDQAMTVRRRQGHMWASAVLAAGVCLLLAGAAHHLSDPTVTMTGGSLMEASQQLGR